MVLPLVTGVLTGALIGGRFRVFALLPAAAAAIAITLFCALLGSTPMLAFQSLFGLVLGLQVGYLAGLFMRPKHRAVPVRVRARR